MPARSVLVRLTALLDQAHSSAQMVGASSLSRYSVPGGQQFSPPRESLQRCHSSGAAARPSATAIPLNASHRDTPPANARAIWSMSQAYFVAIA